MTVIKSVDVNLLEISDNILLARLGHGRLTGVHIHTGVVLSLLTEPTKYCKRKRLCPSTVQFWIATGLEAWETEAESYRKVVFL